MYKLLNPTHLGIDYMVKRFKEFIIRVGDEKIQSLKGENVRMINFTECFSLNFF